MTIEAFDESADQETDAAGTEGHDGAKGVEATDGGLGPQKVWTFDVDGVTYQHDEPQITGGEIMALAGVHPSQILLQYFEDGTEETIDPDDVVRLVPRPHFRRWG
jgi:hypothetical protein